MFCIIFIIALCFSEKLDVLGVSSWRHKECRAMSKMLIAVSIFFMCEAWNFITISLNL